MLQKLPKEEQEYYAKEVYKNGFSLELLEKLKNGERIEESTLDWGIIKEKFEGSKEKDDKSASVTEEKPIESLPLIIKRIEPSTVIIFAYNDKGGFLKQGSGFFISQNGDIITNYHVIQGASSAEVKTSDGKTYPITYIVVEDEQSDIIRLSVDIPSQYVHPLSLSTTVPEVGERILVYGSPLGLEKTVSDGIISAIREVPGYGKLIQITAPISPGSSGSPVLNMNGEVIGIATFQIVEGQNLNFAIPSERIANLDLKKETYPYLEKYKRSEEKKDSDYAYKAINQARIFIDKEEYEEALSCLEIATKTDFLLIKMTAYYIIGFCYNKLGNHSKAIEAYKQAIHINPDYLSAYSSLGGVYFGLGSFTKAIESFKQVIRINPNDAFTYNILGASYLALVNYAKAIEAYQQAIRIDPDNFVAHDGLGLAYFMLGNHIKAIESFKQAIHIDPNIAATYSTLGKAYANLGNHIKAIESFKQAIRINPDYVEAHFLLGVTYLLIRDRNSALNEYKILKELDIDKANELFDFIY